MTCWKMVILFPNRSHLPQRRRHQQQRRHQLGPHPYQKQAEQRPLPRGGGSGAKFKTYAKFISPPTLRQDGADEGEGHPLWRHQKAMSTAGLEQI